MTESLEQHPAEQGARSRHAEIRRETVECLRPWREASRVDWGCLLGVDDE